MSQGGFVSLRVALTAPERVRALVLLDTQAGCEDPEVVPLFRAMLDQWVADGPSDEVAMPAAQLIIGDVQLSATWIATWKSRPPASVARPADTLLGRDDITDRLSEIRCPALVVHGTADVSIPMERAQQLADGLVGCDGVVAVEGGSHAANMTHPDEVNAALGDFLADLPE